MLKLAFVLLLAATPAQRRAVTIVEGRSAVVDLPFKAATGVNSNPTILQSSPIGKTLILFGRSRGVATYVVMDATRKRRIEIDVQVVSIDVHALAGDLRAQIGPDVEGVDVRISGERILVEGEVATEAEKERIAKLCANRPEVTNLVRMSPVALKAVARTIEQEIARNSTGGTVTATADFEDRSTMAAIELEAVRQSRLESALKLDAATSKKIAPVIAEGAKRRARVVELIGAGDAESVAEYEAAGKAESAALRLHLTKEQLDRYEAFRIGFDPLVVDVLGRQAP